MKHIVHDSKQLLPEMPSFADGSIRFGSINVMCIASLQISENN